MAASVCGGGSRGTAPSDIRGAKEGVPSAAADQGCKRRSQLHEKGLLECTVSSGSTKPAACGILTRHQDQRRERHGLHFFSLSFTASNSLTRALVQLQNMPQIQLQNIPQIHPLFPNATAAASGCLLFPCLDNCSSQPNGPPTSLLAPLLIILLQ